MHSYLISILFYLYSLSPVIKALPCLTLYLKTKNTAFLFAAAGDYFLETDFLLPGLLTFSISNVVLFPIKPLETTTLVPFLLVQPALLYAFGWYIIFVDAYVYTLLNMLSRKTLPTTLFVLSDIFVLMQFMGYPVSCISLPLYWAAMWKFSEH